MAPTDPTLPKEKGQEEGCVAEGLVSAHGLVTHPACLLLVPPLAPLLCPHRVAPSDSTSLEEAGQSEGLMREGQTEEGPM